MRSCVIMGHPQSTCSPLQKIDVDSEKPFDFACLLYQLGFREFYTSLQEGIDRMTAYALIRMNLILKDITVHIIMPPRDTNDELAQEACQLIEQYGAQQCASLAEALGNTDCLFLIDSAMPDTYDGKVICLTLGGFNGLSEETILRIEREVSV